MPTHNIGRKGSTCYHNFWEPIFLCMKVVIVECEVEYVGRGETFLPKGVRAVIIKSDGAVSIHSDEGNKPINYMPAGSVLTVTKYKHFERWVFRNKKEEIVLKIFSTHDDHDFIIPTTVNILQRYKTEKELQKELSLNPDRILQHYGYTSKEEHRLEIHTEYTTQAGSIDLLIHNHSLETTHIVELKRTAMLGAVDQCVRYLSAYMDTIEPNLKHYRVTIAVAAYDIRPKTVTLAERNNVDCIILNT